MNSKKQKGGKNRSKRSSNSAKQPDKPSKNATKTELKQDEDKTKSAPKHQNGTKTVSKQHDNSVSKQQNGTKAVTKQNKNKSVSTEPHGSKPRREPQLKSVKPSKGDASEPQLNSDPKSRWASILAYLDEAPSGQHLNNAKPLPEQSNNDIESKMKNGESSDGPQNCTSSRSEQQLLFDTTSWHELYFLNAEISEGRSNAAKPLSERQLNYGAKSGHEPYKLSTKAKAAVDSASVKPRQEQHLNRDLISKQAAPVDFLSTKQTDDPSNVPKSLSEQLPFLDFLHWKYSEKRYGTEPQYSLHSTRSEPPLNVTETLSEVKLYDIKSEQLPFLDFLNSKYSERRLNRTKPLQENVGHAAESVQKTYTLTVTEDELERIIKPLLEAKNDDRKSKNLPFLDPQSAEPSESPRLLKCFKCQAEEALNHDPKPKKVSSLIGDETLTLTEKPARHVAKEKKEPSLKGNKTPTENPVQQNAKPKKEPSLKGDKTLTEKPSHSAKEKKEASLKVNKTPIEKPVSHNAKEGRKASPKGDKSLTEKPPRHTAKEKKESSLKGDNTLKDQSFRLDAESSQEPHAVGIKQSGDPLIKATKSQSEVSSDLNSGQAISLDCPTAEQSAESLKSIISLTDLQRYHDIKSKQMPFLDFLKATPSEPSRPLNRDALVSEGVEALQHDPKPMQDPRLRGAKPLTERPLNGAKPTAGRQRNGAKAVPEKPNVKDEKPPRTHAAFMNKKIRDGFLERREREKLRKSRKKIRTSFQQLHKTLPKSFLPEELSETSIMQKTIEYSSMLGRALDESTASAICERCRTPVIACDCEMSDKLRDPRRYVAEEAERLVQKKREEAMSKMFQHGCGDCEGCMHSCMVMLDEEDFSDSDISDIDERFPHSLTMAFHNKASMRTHTPKGN